MTGSSRAESMITGTSAVAGRPRNCRTMSSPLMPGMTRSWRITVGWKDAAVAMASLDPWQNSKTMSDWPARRRRTAAPIMA